MATHGDFYTARLANRTIASVEHEYPDRRTNDNRETLRLTFTDGTKLTVWSWGYSLDARIDPAR